MDSQDHTIGGRPDRSLIPDLRSFTLGQLARQAADGEKTVTSVISRIVDSRENRSGVPAMMFQSAT